MSESEGCRWCGYTKQYLDSFVAVFEYDVYCPKCNATKSPTVSFKQVDDSQINVWHNPDNSLFIEFQQKDGKTSRYTLSEALMLKAGVLKLSDTPLGGRKG